MFKGVFPPYKWCFILFRDVGTDGTPPLRKSHVALGPFELWKDLPYGVCRGVLLRAFILGYKVIVEPAILVHLP